MFISFIRKGFFEYKTFRRNDELHVGRFLISKPAYEHTTRHIDNQPDVTTSFKFTTGFFRLMQEQYAAEAGWFLNNNDIHSLMLHANPELDYLHHRILQLLSYRQVSGLQIDELVIDMVEKVMLLISGNPGEIAPVSDSLKKFHLVTVENARSISWSILTRTFHFINSHNTVM